MGARREGDSRAQVADGATAENACIPELLARGADVNARANNGWSALHMASYYGHAEALRELLVLRPAVNAQTNDGFTPLMETCFMGHLIAATILIALGADLALLNNAGRSALRFAESRVAQDAVPPAAGAAPLTAAQREEHKKVVTLLKMHGAT